MVKAGQAAWKRLKSKSEKSWNDWMAVGEALLVGREEAMNDDGIPLKSNRAAAGVGLQKRVRDVAAEEQARRHPMANWS